MKKRIPHMDGSSGKRTVVTSEEKLKWIELWPEVRAKVPSNSEAYQALSGIGLRYRDPRTIRSYMEELLPLVNVNAISAVIDLTNHIESRMPIKEFMQMIRERLPIEEVAPKLASLAEVFVKDAPPPSQVISVLGSILSGGFPFDNTRDFK